MGAREIFSREGHGLGYMASAKREPVTGASSQRGPGADPLVKGGGPLEAEAFLHLKKGQNFAVDTPRPSKICRAANKQTLSSSIPHWSVTFS